MGTFVVQIQEYFRNEQANGAKKLKSSAARVLEGYANYVARTGYGLKKFVKPGFLDAFCLPNKEEDKDVINYDHLGAAI